MITSLNLIGGIWVVFLTIWVVGALGAKHTARRGRFLGIVPRVAIAIVLIALARTVRHYHLWHMPPALAPVSPTQANVGVAICALGVAIAVWARVYLGRNWGMPMSLRVGHELVTSGPYRFVRHPIYTGILVAIIGTMLVQWFPAIVLLPIVLAYFIYVAKVEERSMKQQFPDVYPAYMQRTKMLIPFLF